ncbi:MAG: hypothetical protein H6Q07_1412, partial [Acidobacteria bacterium]|nr:hypothetical protein [Acidobacteriota bacterium]
MNKGRLRCAICILGTFMLLALYSGGGILAALAETEGPTTDQWPREITVSQGTVLI